MAPDFLYEKKVSIVTKFVVILHYISTHQRHSEEEQERKCCCIHLPRIWSEAMDDDFDDFLNSVASPPGKATTVGATETSRGQETTTTEKLENSNYDLDFLNDSPTSTLATGATVS